MKFEDLSPEIQEKVRADLKSIINDQTMMANESAEQIRRYLFFVNAGAAVALLSFMGTSPKILEHVAAWIALSLFFLGLLLLGLLQAINYHSTMSLAIRTQEQAPMMFDGAMELEEFENRQNALLRPRWRRTAEIFGWASGVSWIGGTLVAVLGLLPK